MAATCKGGIGFVTAPAHSATHVYFMTFFLIIFQLFILQVLACDIDLLHPPAELEKQRNKFKRLVASPNSYFMDVKCQGCFTM